MRIGFVLPHIFMHKDILGHVIFAPGTIAIDYVKELARIGHKVYFITPNYQVSNKNVININADLSFFERELKERGDSYIDLLKKHPLTFITLSRIVQTELLAKAYTLAKNKEIDVLHFFSNEEEIAMAMSNFSTVPTFFTHHEPFNFLTKYRAQFEKYSYLNWISLSYSQRLNASKKMNWVGNVYNSLPMDRYSLRNEKREYFLYMGRIIENKGVHIAIEACKKKNLKLLIAGKYYDGYGKEGYFKNRIKPYLKKGSIEYIGHVKTTKEKQDLLSKAKALIVPSLWEEPFGMVAIEALACGTPVIASDRGALKEIVEDKKSGLILSTKTEIEFVKQFVKRVDELENISSNDCRNRFENCFSVDKSIKELIKIYSFNS